MADQTPDPTALDDDQLDNLLDRLAERAAERDDLDLPGTGASRRGVLAGLLGLGGAAAGAGVASAIAESESYGNASGVVGTDSEPLNEVNVQDLHVQDLQVDNLLEPNRVPGGLVVAGARDGGDPDARLDNALSDATPGDTVFLESATYDSNRTITTASLHITSGYGGFEGGTTVTGNWTIDGAAVKISNIRFSASVDLNGSISVITDSNSADATINANADFIIIKGVNFSDINFTSGTSEGVVTACTNVTVTDNGSNTIGTNS